MKPSAAARDLKGKRSLSVRARPNLRMAAQRCGAQTIYIVKDPITMRYFRLDEKQRFLLEWMDGAHTLAEIQAAYEREFRPERLSFDELEDFAAELLEGGLVQGDGPGAARRLIERAGRRNQSMWRLLLNFLCLKIPLGNPTRFLTFAQPVGDIVFSRAFAICSLAVFALVLGLLVTHWREFLARLPVYEDFFRLETLLYLWLTFGIVKLLHELGHAFCCQRMGAEVQEVGIVVLFFFPTLYCNVSDAWLLSNKWKRIAVSAAGIYVELLLAAAAGVLWWWTDTATFVHQLAFATMLFCSVNTLVCNANPLMRFDGYHILADWLEAPNLAQQCQRTMQASVLRCLGVEVKEVAPTGRVSARFLFVFGLASLMYRWYVTALMLGFLFEFMRLHHVPVVGWIVAAASLTVLVGVPFARLLHWLYRSGRFVEMKPARLCLTLAVATGAASAFFLIPVPMKVRGVALVQAAPEHVHRVVVPQAEGFLQEMHVRDGQRVKAGEVLAVLVNPKLEIRVRVNESDQALRRHQQNAFIAQFADLDDADDAALAGWQECAHELNALTREHHALRGQCKRLILRAPVDGVIMGLVSREEKGRWLEKGTEFCRVGSAEALRALVLVDSADHSQLHVGSQGSIVIHGAAGRTCAGVVTAIAHVDAANIPVALSNRGGGEIATRHDAATNTEKPHGRYYLVSIHLKADPAVHPGVLGRVKIDAEPRTLAWRLRRFLGSTVNWGL